MNICYFHHGISIHDRRLITELAKTNDVTLLSFYHGILKYDDKNIKMMQYRLPKPRYSFIYAPIISKYLFNKMNWDVVLATYITTYGFYAAFGNAKPFVLNTMGSDIYQNPRRLLLNALTGYTIRHADKIIADSSFGNEKLHEFGAKSEQSVKIPWGVDLNLFNPNNKPINLGWEDNRVIVCTRQHESIYGIKYLLYAIPDVIKKFDDARFLIIGHGSLHERLVRLSKKLQIDHYIKFIGHVDHATMGGYLKSANIYVSPALSDAASVALLEAMAVGLPVVITDIPSTNEWVNEIIVPKCSAKGISDGICYLLANEEQMHELGERNHYFVRKNGDFRNTICKLIHVLESAIDNHRSL